MELIDRLRSSATKVLRIGMNVDKAKNTVIEVLDRLVEDGPREFADDEAGYGKDGFWCGVQVLRGDPVLGDGDRLVVTCCLGECGEEALVRQYRKMLEWNAEEGQPVQCGVRGMEIWLEASERLDLLTEAKIESLLIDIPSYASTAYEQLVEIGMIAAT